MSVYPDVCGTTIVFTDGSTAPCYGGRTHINAAIPHYAAPFSEWDGRHPAYAINDKTGEITNVEGRWVLTPEQATARLDPIVAAADACSLPDTPDVPPSGEVYVPAGTTTTATGRTVPRRAYVRHQQKG